MTDENLVERTAMLYSLLSKAEEGLEYVISQGMHEPPEPAMLEDEELIASLERVIPRLEKYAGSIKRQREATLGAQNVAGMLQAAARMPELQDEEIGAALLLLQDRLSKIEELDIPF